MLKNMRWELFGACVCVFVVFIYFLYVSIVLLASYKFDVGVSFGSVHLFIVCLL